MRPGYDLRTRGCIVEDAMTTPPTTSTDPIPVLSHFWSPLTAVGSHGPDGPNAQICVSVFGASIVPERPRLLVVLSKTNYTTTLVEACGTLAITLLSDQQWELLTPLGLRSGRDGDKLADVVYELTPAGDPWFPEGVGAVDCSVIDQYDLGDAAAFLCAVKSQRSLTRSTVLTWQHARTIVGDEFLRLWSEKSALEREAAYETMHWRAP
jgi:flavin reductase (DIM6/NTAB) family NADH-FMN oxidoreductase RutF